jgi:hypothetical protein
MSAVPATSPQTAHSLEEALLRAKERWVPHGRFSMLYSSVFWLDVFVLIYGEYPKDPNTLEERRLGKRDPRWDTLFHEGGFKKFDELFGTK